MTLASREEGEEEEPSENEDSSSSQGVFKKIFGLVFIGEMGDETQLAVISLAAAYSAPLEVFAGAVLAFMLVTLIGVSIGSWLGDKFNTELVEKAGGILFIVLGALMLAEALSAF